MGDVVVIGAGGAAWAFCRRLVAGGWRGGRITVLGDERHAPYARAQLPQILRGRAADAATLAPAEWYAANGIDLRLDDPAVAIDRARGVVATARGESLPFAHLVLATGSGPWLPPIAGRDQTGVLALRSLDDAVALRAAARRAQRVVVLGGGPFGVEAAAALNDAGVAVSLIEVAAG
ncbi:MAG TPA: FAD-dependent oxidoreductase, partial [Longimicrobiaceae bacterium]|nr:FAD-dependent oxidoreductase [Longimicrobiaceae bacterium]